MQLNHAVRPIGELVRRTELGRVHPPIQIRERTENKRGAGDASEANLGRRWRYSPKRLLYPANGQKGVVAYSFWSLSSFWALQNLHGEEDAIQGLRGVTKIDRSVLREGSKVSGTDGLSKPSNPTDCDVQFST
jgi:hypothetical protein